MTHETELSGCAGERPATARTPARRLALAAVAGALAVVTAGCGQQVADDEPAKAVLSDSGTTAAPDAQIDPTPSAGQTPVGGAPWDQEASEACAAAVGEGLTQVAQSADEHGVTTFWASGRRWTVCDVAAGGSQPALIGPRRGATGFDERSLALTSTRLDDGAVRYVAAGRLPWPVQEIGYTLPDDTLAQARFVTSEDDPDVAWWVVAHTAVDGPLADGAQTGLPPVTITVTGGAAEAFRVPWEDLQRSE